MVYIGDVPTFGDEGFQEDYEKFEHFCHAYNIPAEKKSKLAVLALDERDYMFLRESCSPIKPQDMRYDELLKVLHRIFYVPVELFSTRYTFYNAEQLPDEMIVVWFYRIKKLSINCRFGINYESILLDRFITGLKSTKILDLICDKDDLNMSLVDTVQLAIHLEQNKLVENYFLFFYFEFLKEIFKKKKHVK